MSLRHQYVWSVSAVLVGVVLAASGVEAAPKSAWVTTAVGTVTVRGSATTSPSGRITVSGEGTDIWLTADGFQFLYQRLSGDGQITAKITGLQNTDGWAKAGLMIRQGLTSGSVHAALLATPLNGIVFEQRATTGGLTTRTGVGGAAPSWLRLRRSGEWLTAAVSSDGMTWVDVGSQSVPMSADVLIGLAVTSHYPSRLTSATFDKVAVTKLATSTTPPAGPVAAWSFDDGAGSLLRASVGGLDGVITGATWTTAGRNGGALVFNGVDNVVTVAPNAALNLTTGMTVEAWVYPMALSNWRSVAMKEGSNDLAWALYANDASAQPEAVINTGAGAQGTSGTVQLQSNAWSHLATTFDGSTHRLFVNGVQVGSVAETGTLMQTTGPFRIGGNSVWGEWFNGALDDMRIYNRALSASEIQTDMNTAVEAPAADTTPPNVGISTPVTAATVSGMVGVVATATDNVGVASVQFLLNGANLGPALSTSPYTTVWDTKAVANGTYSLTAVARDFAGNANVSADVSVTVSNADTTAPTVAISAPAVGSTLSGAVTVTATASDDVGVTSVQFRLDGADLGGLDTTAPYSVVWNTSAATSGSHTLTAVARDAAGNVTISQGLAVTVADTSMPTVSISAPAGGSTVSGSVAVAAVASDNVGVASVQFRVNGANLGGAVTAPPFSIVWNTSAVPNGTYQLTAVARDAAGNSSVSPAVSVTVNNASPLAVGRTVQFTSADHLATLPDGRATVDSYTLEVWLPGSNISTGQPYKTSNLGKPASTTTTITVDQQTFFATLPKGQEFFTTVTATGPAGSARSTASNSFMMQ